MMVEVHPNEWQPMHGYTITTTQDGYTRLHNAHTGGWRDYPTREAAEAFANRWAHVK